MKPFLITFKPSSESPERGWPLSELQNVVRQFERHGTAEVIWRFVSHKQAKIGDRIFLLLQGKGGPAIIGYGSVVGAPSNGDGAWRIPIRFDAITDPSKEVLASKSDLSAIEGSQQLWRSQASGVLIPDNIATELETMIVGRTPEPREEAPISNPDWTRDELILSLNVYLATRPNPPGKESREIRELSELLNRLGEKLFSSEDRAATFRNENGVYMKLMNFRRLDPEYTAGGKTGLSRGAKAEEEVWAEFAHDPNRCREVANAIIAALDDSEVLSSWESDADQGLQEAVEGRLLTRTHLARERNRSLVESKRRQALKKYGRLACEACGFDFASAYGERGEGFIECHHTKPVALLQPGQKTHVDDLSLVCANCHRVIHRNKKWLTVAELRLLIRQSKQPQ